MGQGQSHNLFEAAASDELERARYSIEHDHTDVNSTDKVRVGLCVVSFQHRKYKLSCLLIGFKRFCLPTASQRSGLHTSGWLDSPTLRSVWG